MPELPQWVRIVLVVLLGALAAGATALGYRDLTAPVAFTVAVGSADREATTLMQTIASRLASTGASVRLKVVDAGTMQEAARQFADRKVDLAVVRADAAGLKDARSVVTMAYGVVMILVPPGSAVDSIDKLKGKTIGVVGGEVNASLMQILGTEYDFDANKVRIKNLDSQNAARAVASKEVAALVVVTPVVPRFIAKVRSYFAGGQRPPSLIPIEAAGAIAEATKAYESYDLPKGSLRGSPAVPDDDLTTLRVPLYLVAAKSLADENVASLTKAILDTRRELVGSVPLLAQIASPGTDKDAFIPLHGGASIYFNGDEQSFLDRYSNALFYGPWFAGGVLSALLWAWRFIGFGPDRDRGARTELQVLAGRAGSASSREELADLEREIDNILMRRLAERRADATDAAALSLLAQRLERLIERRSRLLPERPAATSKDVAPARVAGDRA